METIGYIGNFTYPYCTEVHIANTLERLGYNVIRIQETPDLALDRFGDIDFWKFLLWTRTPGLETPNMWSILDMCHRRHIPTVSYHLDLYIGLRRADGLDNDPFWRTDYVFQPDGDPDSMKIFKEKGINAYWQKPAVDKAECYIADEPITRDIVFVGLKGYHPEWPYRPKLIEWLRDTYPGRFEHWGHDGLGSVRNDALNRLFASTKVVIGDSLCLPGHTRYWSDRPYETLGRGGFLIMPWVQGLHQELKTYQDLVYYSFGNFKELKFMIDYFLDDENQAERESIRRHGHETVKRHYTYDERLKDMFKVLSHEVKK